MEADVQSLSDIIGLENLVTDATELEYAAQDYFARGDQPLAIARPQSIEALSKLVAAATSQGLAIFPRGGGYSYTNGYLPTRPGITIDLQGLNRIIEINADDMFVTVEAGCTWAALDAALKPLGLRTPFWGPFSGLNATVGGGVSQGSISWGSSRYGVSSESVLDLEIVCANGTRVRTGASGQPGHSPFFRNYGPDLTGIFLSDCGALGIKATITLKLMRRPAHSLGLSFAFPSLEEGVAAAADVARENVVTDTVGVLAARARAAATKQSLAKDLKALWKIGQTGVGVFDSVKRMARVALAGRRFLEDLDFTFHFIVEGPNRETVAAHAKTVRDAIAGRGLEIANTIPTMMRAEPFQKYDMLNEAGQRQLPPSTILPLSRVIGFHTAFFAAIAPLADEMAKSSMNVFPVFATIGTTGFLYEPVIAWNDAPELFHRRHTKPALIAQIEDRKPDPEARALAAQIRQIMIDLSFQMGGIHLQIGKIYPLLRERDATATALLHDIKRRTDPDGLLNPGALGMGL